MKPSARPIPWLAALALVTNFVGLLSAAEHAPIDWNKARQHWSFVPPKPQIAPRVIDTTWPKQRVDQFILAR
ncbi:MAG TPA: hypothetical protein VGH65_01055, partial [Verrucomicrobiaceae bacterium]